MSADYAYDPSAPDNLTGLLKTLEAGDHTTSSDDWHALLQESHPVSYAPKRKRMNYDESYQEPALQGSGTVTLTQKDRVELLRLRHAKGQQLYHEKDVLHDMREDLVEEMTYDDRHRRTGRKRLVNRKAVQKGEPVLRLSGKGEGRAA